jgi:hypothetical protein
MKTTKSMCDLDDVVFDPLIILSELDYYSTRENVLV